MKEIIATENWLCDCRLDSRGTQQSSSRVPVQNMKRLGGSFWEMIDSNDLGQWHDMVNWRCCGSISFHELTCFNEQSTLFHNTRFIIYTESKRHFSSSEIDLYETALWKEKSSHKSQKLHVQMKSFKQKVPKHNSYEYFAIVQTTIQHKVATLADEVLHWCSGKGYMLEVSRISLNKIKMW